MKELFPFKTNLSTQVPEHLKTLKASQFDKRFILIALL